ncbi:MULTISPECIES: hypothetical protein [unclassified Microbacterium]|uniref:hypothetical protein n=1 Tax=unclassified Microbacterium TaxID=2609290 RepID=UPI0012FA7CBF|nr:hypothetical protein [Microbacterium sp. MAH-37]MVQ41074.1 hypothetical protein [Microbacterium sp. MAH-37]
MTLGLPQLPPSVPAYRVPWRVLRDERAHPVVVNGGDEPVDFVRVFHDVPATGIVTDLWGQVLPAERLELCLCAADLDDVVVTLAWFRPDDGLEYVWRFVV